MVLGDRLGIAGLILALIALAATVLWPDKKWIGWLSLCLAVLLLLGWGWLEFGDYIPKLSASHPLFTRFLVFCVGGLVSTSLWLLLQPKISGTKPPAPSTYPTAKETPKETTPPTTQPAQSQKRRENAHVTVPQKLPPYVRTESFSIDIPYFTGDGFPINQFISGGADSPLNDTYGCISKVLLVYANAEPGNQIKQIADLDSNDKRSTALAEALRYCIIEEIRRAERGSSKFGFDAKKGSVAEYDPGFPPPDSTDYPTEKFLALLDTLPFGKAESIQMIFKVRPLQVPKGSNLELLTLKINPNDWMNHLAFRMSKPDVFSFAVGVAPINAGLGMLPGWVPDRLNQQAHYVTYSLAITMKIEITRTSTNGPEVEDFQRWSDAMWEAIKRKFLLKPAS
jgi:hypothetical protein